MIDDEKIIELFFERSEQAIRELDIKYGKICHNLSYNIVNSRQDAEECVNDAYLGAWNAIPPVRPNPLLSYIVKIVRNISLKIYWRKEAAKRSGHYTIALEEIEGCIADQKTVEDEIEARELARIIEAFLDTLTVKERVIFMRRYGSDRAALEQDFAARVQEYQRLYNVDVRQVEAPGLYKYYSTQRPVDIGTFPKPPRNAPDEIVNYDQRVPVENGSFLAWGHLTYTRPLTKRQASDYELRPAPDNPDRPRSIREQMKTAAKQAEADRGQTAPKKNAPDRGER